MNFGRSEWAMTVVAKVIERCQTEGIDCFSKALSSSKHRLKNYVDSGDQTDIYDQIS